MNILATRKSEQNRAAVAYTWTRARFTEDDEVVRSGAEGPGFPEHS